MKILAILFLVLISSHFALAEDTQKIFLPLTYSPTCILEAVATQLNVQLKSEIVLPELHPHSTTTLEEFKVGARFNYPDDYVIEYFANVYSTENNAIYINDSIPLVGKNGRTSDDVLAHELTHYFQANYFNYTKEDRSSDEAEEAAVRVQTWFRESFMISNPSAFPCPKARGQGKEFSKIWKW